METISQPHSGRHRPASQPNRRCTQFSPRRKRGKMPRRWRSGRRRETGDRVEPVPPRGPVVPTKVPRLRRSRCPGRHKRPKERTAGLWRGRGWLLVPQPACRRGAASVWTRWKRGRFPPHRLGGTAGGHNGDTPPPPEGDRDLTNSFISTMFVCTLWEIHHAIQDSLLVEMVA